MRRSTPKSCEGLITVPKTVIMTSPCGHQGQCRVDIMTAQNHLITVDRIKTAKAERKRLLNTTKNWTQKAGRWNHEY